jgi:hypothetical protein
VLSRVIYKKQRGRRWLTALAVVSVISGTLLIAGGALAVHDTGRFQLDGDAATGTNTAGTPAATDDWDKVCYEVAVKPVAQGGGGLSAAAALAKCGIGSPTTGATETAWTAEPDLSASIFVGGGSKDPQNLNQWAWKDAGGLPDKDNLLHSFAARYSLTPSVNCPAGTFPTCDLLFFGLDRIDNSGDAQNGFWFFQSKVTTAGGKVGGATGFTGLHTPGDVLVVSDFSNGGTISTITVYTWDPTCTATNKPAGFCADANLHLQATSANANCATLPAGQDVGDRACGLVNPSTITMPWAFVDKSGTPNNGALNGEFYEAGINLSALNLAGQCFSSVLSETRSSTSTTAVLKDFILGQLGACQPTLTTDVDGLAANAVVSPGTSITDTATVTVTGAASPDDATGTVDFFLCYSATAVPDCSTGGTGVGTDKPLAGGANTTDGISTATSDAVNTAASPLAPGYYCFRAIADVTNYDDPAAHTNVTTECFQVQDTSTITTAQNWLPNDTATVLKSDGVTPASGTVDFTLYSNATCTAGTGDVNVLATFLDRPVDASGKASTNNTTTYVVTTPGATISWRATFDSSDPNVIGSTSNCETSTVTIAD